MGFQGRGFKFMCRVHGLIRYAILLIIIPGVILFVHSRDASSSEQSDLFDQNVIEFVGLVSAYGEGSNILLAQNQEEGVEDSQQPAPSDEEEPFPDEDFPDDDLPLDDAVGIADPLEPINRAFFVFNDKMYFWVLKPLASGYKYVAPEPVRVGIGNFFYNLAFPIRFVNCALQGKVFEASEEIRRFVINTTAGAAGFIDVATNHSKIKKYDEDLGQTFGLWGLGPGFYINWPILGPSTFRDTFGFVGDAFLYPVSFIFEPSVYTLSINAFDIVNQTSLRIGDYEDLKKAAFDPYIALRDAYYQNRRSKIEQ
jgi:phospholipid-binding lipoprotein MlaA